MILHGYFLLPFRSQKHSYAPIPLSDGQDVCSFASIQGVRRDGSVFSALIITRGATLEAGALPWRHVTGLPSQHITWKLCA